MANTGKAFLEKALAAKQKLMDQFFHLPEVEMIDIGYNLEDPQRAEEMTLRIHVRPGTESHLAIPAHVDGIPVILVTASYNE